MTDEVRLPLNTYRGTCSVLTSCISLVWKLPHVWTQSRGLCGALECSSTPCCPPPYTSWTTWHSSNFQYFCIAPFHSVYALLYYYSLLMRTGQHPFFSGPIWGIDDHYFRSKSGPFSKVWFSCEHSGKILLLYNWGNCKNWTLMASTSAWEGPILFSSCTATPGVNLKGTHYIETFSTCRDVSM